jgi:hypothetical protein
MKADSARKAATEFQPSRFESFILTADIFSLKPYFTSRRLTRIEA